MKNINIQVGKKYLISFTKEKNPGYSDDVYYEGIGSLIDIDPPNYPVGVYKFLLQEDMYGYFSANDIVEEYTAGDFINRCYCNYDSNSSSYHFVCQYRVENKNIDPLRLCSLSAKANGWLISEMNRIIKPYKRINAIGKEIFKNTFYITIEDNVLCFNSQKIIESRKV